MKKILLTLFLLASFSIPAGATDYYVKNSGSDGNTGLSDGQAWQTIAKVNATSFSPGDNIYFNKGDTWNEVFTVPSGGSVGNHITFGAYGTGARPKIMGTTTSQNSMVLAYSPLRGYITFNGIEFGTQSNINSYNAPDGTGAAGPVYIKGCSSSIYFENVKCTDHRTNASVGNGSSNWEDQCIHIDDCTDAWINNSDIDGGTHGIIMSVVNTDRAYIKVSDSTIHDQDNNTSFGDWDGIKIGVLPVSACGLTAHPNADFSGTIIEDNEFYGASENAMDLFLVSGSVIVRNNYIHSPGTKYTSSDRSVNAIKLPYSSGTACGVSYTNFIFNTATSLAIYGNRFYDQKTYDGIRGSAWANGDTADFDIYNNLVVIPSSCTSGCYASYLRLNAAHTYRVYNNTFINISPGNAEGGVKFVGQGNSANSSPGTVDFKNNIIDSPARTHPPGYDSPDMVVASNATVNSSYNIFANATSVTPYNFGTEGTYNDNGGNQYATDPDLDVDYKPESTSAAIDAGATIALVTTDLAGTTRPQDDAYDVGAYEIDITPNYSCTGSVPSNATLCSGDNSGLSGDTARTLATTCGTPKCEYTCSPGYSYSAGTCVTAPAYYVDSVAGSNSNSGTDSDHPWQTLGMVDATTLVAGTTVYLKCGSSWSERLFPGESGTAENHITYTSYGTCTDLNRPNIAGTGSNNNSLIITNVGYLTFDGLKITGSRAVASETVSNVVVSNPTGDVWFDDMKFVYNLDYANTNVSLEYTGSYNIKIENSEVDGSRYGIRIKCADGTLCSGIEIRDNVIHNLRYGTHEDWDAIKGCGEVPLLSGDVSGLVIDGNEIYDFGEDGIDFIACKGDYTISNNYIHDPNSIYTGSTKNINAIKPTNTSSFPNAAGGTKTIVNNRMENISANGVGSCLNSVGNHLLIYNNLCTGTAGTGFHLQNVLAGSQFYNNTVVTSLTAGTAALNVRGTTSGLSVKNNILSAGAGEDYTNRDTATSTYSNNILAGDASVNVLGGTATNGGSNQFATDPLLNASYQPQQSSPALEAGATITEFTDDIIGTARPQNSNYDVGAYEILIPTPYACIGDIPDDNATLCSGDSSSLTEDTTRVLAASCGTPKCEYSCDSGYLYSGGVCLEVSDYIRIQGINIRGVNWSE